MTKLSLESMAASMSRAQRNTTGYFTGYIQKRQPVGRFELRQASLNLNYLAESIRKRSNKQHFHHAANTVYKDLECRGQVRPATEEFNLAGNYHPEDMRYAESLFSFQTVPFYGSALLKREEAEKKMLQPQEPGDSHTQRSRIPLQQAESRSKYRCEISATEAYGYRGRDPGFYYLSPWEFSQHWRKEALKTPDFYYAIDEDSKTEWTPAGREEVTRRKRDGGNDDDGAYKPGVHFGVVEPAESSHWKPFPATPETSTLRNYWVLVRRERPLVVEPKSTPLLRKGQQHQERGRLLNVYFRPWVLQESQASAHVPHIANLDFKISDVLNQSHGRRRMRCKTTVHALSLIHISEPTRPERIGVAGVGV